MSATIVVEGQEVPLHADGVGLRIVPPMLVLAVLLQRAGGEVRISQADIDAAAYGRIAEGFIGKDLLLTYIARPQQ